MNFNIKKIYKIMFDFDGTIVRVDRSNQLQNSLYVLMKYREKVVGRKLGLSSNRLRLDPENETNK